MIPQDDELTGDPIEAYLSDREHKSETTRETAERTLRDLRGFIKEEYGASAALDQMTDTVIEKFARHLLEDGHSHYIDGNPLAESSLRPVFAALTDFYEWGGKYGYPNPVPEARERFDLTKSSPPKIPQIEPIEWRTLVTQTKNHRARAMLTTFLKTGIRVGELCNLDVCDVNISHEGFKSEYSHIEFYANSNDSPQKWPDTLYIRSDIKQGHTVDGEHRPHGTKRDRGTPYPIDSELQHDLLRWLKVRPPTPDQPNNPLFTKLQNDPGERVTRSSVVNPIEQTLERHEFGWEFDPHDFRRYWNTYLTDDAEWGGQMRRGALKYLRGDSLTEDMIQTYTQDWAYKVREPYEENIYSLL